VGGGTLRGGDGIGLTGDGGAGLYDTSAATLVITGGTFVGGSGNPIGGADGAALAYSARGDARVSGGTFRGYISIGLYPDSGTIAFLGTGLSYDGDLRGGILTGTLLDGSSIDAAIRLDGAAYGYSVTPTRVAFGPGVAAQAPEPATAVLLGAGLLGALALARPWRRDPGHARRVSRGRLPAE
jgi:hypothetical protein